MIKIVYSPLSLNDLASIRDYIYFDLANPMAAERTVRNIINKVRLLEGAPEIGTPLSSICDVDTDYRFLVCKNHLVFYRYEDAQRSAYIIRILYGRSNYLATLFGESLEGDTNDLFF